jgi:DNA-binding transcriptional LysR family regulator
MNKLACMKTFVAVAESGGFARAADRLSLSPAVVSRSVMDLERELRTRLFNRTTRQVSLTDAGHRYLEHCTEILSLVEQADAEAMGASAIPSGKLRVHATASYGQHYLMPALARYAQKYEDVSVDIVLSQRVPDLLEERFDVVFAIAQSLRDSSMVAQHIGTFRQVLCAAPRYIEEKGSPLTIDDLHRHTIVQLAANDGQVMPWKFDNVGSTLFYPQRPAQLTVNVPEALSEAIRAGMGIGMLPVPTALRGIKDGALAEVLHGEPLQRGNVYALYASRQFLDAKIKTLLEFLRAEVPDRMFEHEEELRRFASSPRKWR